MKFLCKSAALGCILVVGCSLGLAAAAQSQDVASVAQRVSRHSFHPLNNDGSFTVDRELGKHGIANLNDEDWHVRLLAIRDLVKALPAERDDVVEALRHQSLHVRQIAGAALGIARQREAAKALEAVLQADSSALVRAQAAMSLGQIESHDSLELLRQRFKDDPSKDVHHQCELAIDQIVKQRGATTSQLEAFRALDPSTFERVSVGEPAPDFTLSDTEGAPWQFREANQDQWVVLIWIFADWCPVCHGEFNDLIALQQEFEDLSVNVATIECHDRYRTRLMVGKEVDAEYWFAKDSFQQKYRRSIWWPHLSDLAGAVGAQYGVDPMAFAVHAEYINRPSTIIIDPEGIVRFAYRGTFWGDRPSIHETLEMIKNERFEYAHPRRLKISEATSE